MTDMTDNYDLISVATGNIFLSKLDPILPHQLHVTFH
jgi:hypothetical protein